MVHFWMKRSTPFSLFPLQKEWTTSGHQSLSLLSVVQSRLVIPFFASTESQEFKYGINAHKRTRHCALRHFLRPDLYLCCLFCNLGLSYHFFASTESQEFNYGFSVRNRTRHCDLRHFLRPDLYLCCLWCNVGLSYQQ